MTHDPISIEVSGQLPHSLDLALANHLKPTINSLLTDYKVQFVRSVISKNEIPNYEEHWPAFSYLYYPSNYLKAYLAADVISKSIPDKELTILDLGCGSGASAAGFASGLRNSGLAVKKIIGVDVSESQLGVFNSITAPWIATQLGIPVQSVHSDMITYCNNDNQQPDVVLLSYSATELANLRKEELLTILSSQYTAKGALVVIIDSDLSGRGFELQIVDGERILIPYDNVLFQCPELEALGLSEPPKFSISKTGHHLAFRYFEAWKNHDINLLEEIFDDNCTYRINCDRKLSGINSLRQYWIKNSSQQRFVTTDYRVLSEKRNRIFIEWHASFMRSDTQDWRHLDGFMEYEISNGKILHLTEYYSQRRGPTQTTYLK